MNVLFPFCSVFLRCHLVLARFLLKSHMVNSIIPGPIVALTKVWGQRCSASLCMAVFPPRCLSSPISTAMCRKVRLCLHTQQLLSASGGAGDEERQGKGCSGDRCIYAHGDKNTLMVGIST